MLLIPSLSFASLGMHASFPLIKKDPPGLKGFLIGGLYDPETLVWRRFHLFFALDLSHWWVNSSSNHNTTIVALVPVVRYIFKEHFSVAPYFEFSVGPAYTSSTRIKNRNLGEHFTFQDRVGLGALVGQTKRFSIGLYGLHYSNGSLCAHNSGITVPLMLDIGYRFN